MDIANGVTVMVKTIDVKPSPFNPSPRTTPGALRDLLAEIKSAGRIINPLVISADDGYLADGHRRWACAQLLGMDEVPCRYEPGSSAALFRMLNGGTRPVTGRDWSTAVAGGLGIEFVRRRYQADMETLLRILGPEDFRDLFGTRQLSPNIIRTANKVASYVEDESDEMLRMIVLWLERYNLQKLIREAIETDLIDSYTLLTAIVEDRRLERGYRVA